jgi:hypothetical protein
MQVNSDDRAIGDIFRDFFSLLALLFLVIAVLLAIYASPIVEEASEIESPGELYVEIIWPPESTADIDLWVQSADNPPVGYRNKSGLYLNLLRDDLGSAGDFSGYNSEITFSRGTAVGLHTVNVHIYRNAALERNIELKYIVKIKRPNETKHSTVSIGQTILEGTAGLEVTLVSFEINQNGIVDSQSIDRKTQKSLRNIKQTNAHVPAEQTVHSP